MSKSISKRLIGTYLIIIILILVATGAILSVSIRQYYLENVQDNLVNDAALVVEILEISDDGETDFNNSLQDISDFVNADIDARVTVIDKQGTVLADSMVDPKTMGPHDGRPEIYTAMQGNTGIQIRFSESVGEQLIYVAVPFETSSIQGVVRLARSLHDINQVYFQVLIIMLLAILLIGIIAFIVSTRLAANFSRPLIELTGAVEEIAQGNLDKKISYWADDEMGVLASAVNHMAREMDKNITEISAVKNRLEVLLNNTVNGIVMVDLDTRITYANPKAIKLLAMEKDFYGRKHVEVINNYDLLEAIDEVSRTSHSVRKEIQLFTPVESQIEAYVLPLCKDIPRGYGGVLVVLNDITELKRLERVRRDFAANVSHELKTPVASIRGFAETLMNENGENPKTVREFSQIIYDEAIRLSKLISRLLELSRMESGKSGLNIGSVDMVKLMEDTAALVERDSGNMGKINIKKPAGQVVIECDRELIMQALFNLLDNAIAYSPEGESVSIALEEDDKQVKVMVSDRGEGIPANETDRVFERFYRVDKARSRKTGGTGLGLSIVKHLVEKHNGQVGVESSPGQGSTFYFTIPRKQN